MLSDTNQSNNYYSTYMKHLEYLTSQGQNGGCWRLGGGGTRRYSVGSVSIPFCKTEKSSGDWLHNPVNVLNFTELYA